ncbi:MAG: TRAP transporter substrate-binding protein [Syntrophorhabdaceae bacterium]|nr:TRAP transporter substrate-binding protein [Syntrophorhabdaceae bacterium]
MKTKMVFVLFFAAMTAGILFQPRASGASDAVITLTYANFPPASTFPCVQMERWAREVEKRTAGKVKIRTFPGGTLLPAKNIMDGVVSGLADIGNFAMSYQPGRFPVSEAIDLPLGFTNSRVASLTLYDLVEKYQPNEFSQVKILAFFTCPPTNLMTRVPVKSLADLKGMELRVAGTSVDIVKRLGGIPVAMPQSETPEAIQKGVVKGIVSSLEILQDFKFAAYTQHATIVNLPVVSFAVVMNKGRWNSLPPEVKKVMDDMRREHSEWTGEYVDYHVREALEWSKKAHNHHVYALSEADAGAVKELLKPITDGYVARVSALGLPADKIVSDALELKKRNERPGK